MLTVWPQVIWLEFLGVKPCIHDDDAKSNVCLKSQKTLNYSDNCLDTQLIVNSYETIRHMVNNDTVKQPGAFIVAESILLYLVLLHNVHFWPLVYDLRFFYKGVFWEQV